MAITRIMNWNDSYYEVWLYLNLYFTRLGVCYTEGKFERHILYQYAHCFHVCFFVFLSIYIVQVLSIILSQWHCIHFVRKIFPITYTNQTTAWNTYSMYQKFCGVCISEGWKFIIMIMFFLVCVVAWLHTQCYCHSPVALAWLTTLFSWPVTGN
jgi:hypothetical protein